MSEPIFNSRSKPPRGTAIIYALRDPRTDAVRYVGKTNASIDERLDAHVRAARRVFPGCLVPIPTSKLHCWIVALAREKKRPGISEIVRVDSLESSAHEIQWIAYYRERGCDLLNMTSGGHWPGTRERPLTLDERIELCAYPH